MSKLRIEFTATASDEAFSQSTDKVEVKFADCVLTVVEEGEDITIYFKYPDGDSLVMEQVRVD